MFYTRETSFFHVRHIFWQKPKPPMLLLLYFHKQGNEQVQSMLRTMVFCKQYKHAWIPWYILQKSTCLKHCKHNFCIHEATACKCLGYKFQSFTGVCWQHALHWSKIPLVLGASNEKTTSCSAHNRHNL